MSRAYLRLDPAFFDRKVIEQKYPPGAAIALIGALCHAEHQPQRGRFRDVRVLKALLGPLAKWIPFLIEHRDLVNKKGELYVDGWDEWQEGDWKVGERVRRIRSRQKGLAADAAVTVAVTPDVTVAVTPDVTVETVYNLSDGRRQSVIDSGGGKRSDTPQPPASGGRRALGTNPRAITAGEAAKEAESQEGRRYRMSQRQLAYLRGAITAEQEAAMNLADAPLSDIPDAEEHQAAIEQDSAAWPL
jgi:hypothetical protein